jgi:polysaccharide pyruvyl transferase WcaK-like protein
MPPKFKEHLASFADRIVFMGMRNSGSMQNIKEYLPEEKQACIAYQPCPTTVIKCLYPALFRINGKQSDRPVLGLNCAFDRSDARFQGTQEEICGEIAAAIKKLSDTFVIDYVIHSPEDDLFVPYLKKYGVPFSVKNLVNTTPKYIVQYYQRLAIMLGMRGHSQMVPFGCGIPIISLISHDKLKWFLQDIEREEWGIEVQAKRLKDEIVDKVEDLYAREASIREDIAAIQQDLLVTTKQNVKKVINEFRTHQFATY